MNLLEQLEQVTEQERAALVQGDWRALEACIDQKNGLATQVAALQPSSADRIRARRLSEATRYNLELAAALSNQLGDLLSWRQRKPTYNRAGRLPQQAQPVVSICG